jgi:hypothetical protein
MIKARLYEGAEMKKKKVVRRAWTKDDLRLLKSLAREKKGAKKIAKALKRTEGATTVMAAKRGIRALAARRPAHFRRRICL